MLKAKLSPAQKDALQRIHDAGFPYMKVEFEAQLRRKRDFSSESDCTHWLYTRLSAQAKRWLVFSMFYNDHSVDSEYTITFPTLQAHLFLEVNELFVALSKANKGTMDVRGAGLHISVLTTSEYPCTAGLDARKQENFTRQVQKLLPALFFLASSNSNSRALTFREPRITAAKYSAIHVMRGAFEYRVFETCYDNSEILLDYFEVIANTLRYYADPAKKAIINFNGQFGFPNTKRNVARFFDNPQALFLLQQTVDLIKPKDKTFAALKRERAVKVTERALEKALAKEDAMFAKDYDELADRWNYKVKALKDANLPVLVGDVPRQLRKLHEPAFLKWCLDRKLIEQPPPTRRVYTLARKTAKVSNVVKITINGAA